MKIISKYNTNKISSFSELLQGLVPDDQHFYFEMLEALGKVKSDIVIWGTYGNAKKLFRYLQKAGINNIKACVVNKKYVNDSLNRTETDADFPLYSLEEWLDDHESTSIIVDFSFYTDELLKDYEHKVDHLFVGDNMGTFVFDEPYVITREMVLSKQEQLKEVYSLFADDKSREEFTEYIYQKNTGAYNKEYHPDQYFDREVVELGRNEVYVDCGAFNGDTVKKFIDKVGTFESIYAFEMDRINFENLQQNTSDIADCHLFNLGVGNVNEKVPASVGNNSTSYIGSGDGFAEVRKMDDVIDDRVSFIKMDIEGYELEALKGGRRLIVQYHPKLAICVYHKFEDLWEIPAYIRALNPGYRLFFRNHHGSASEAVLYAV